MFNAKKIAITLAAAALMMGVSTSAFAAFADMELIRVVYERTTGTTEQLTDLGSITSLLSGTHTIAGDALSATNPSNLYVGYFALDRATNHVWATSGNANAPVMTGTLALNTLKNGTNSVYSYYNSLTADAQGVVTGAQNNTNSYRGKLSASQGRLGTALNGNSTIEGSLSNGSLVQSLYYWSDASISGSVGQQISGLTIATNANGSTTVTATPIPAAIYLMGSGLLGLVGVRRRKNA
ncbi:MAG: VPLPA-CTERM sorting domain-containing protein [Desulfuromonadales bacterium]|nr:VPLPA-CTERM sorting domain-containing protein [Desulfuromonadales bacterium]